MMSVGLIIVLAIGALILLLCSSLLFTRFKEWFLRDRTNGAGKSASLAGNLVREVQGKLSDNYRLSKHSLGKGVSAECYVGTHVESKRDYAVKIIDTCDEKILKYYEKEIQLLRSLEHTNIVRLYEVYRGTNTLNLVMELCLGGHLGEVIHSQPEGRLDEGIAQGYIAQLVGAVAHCHGRGICHRDIKLQNILLDTKGRDGQIKLIDFGHAKRFEIDHEGPVFTKMAGTTYTMAPEVISLCPSLLLTSSLSSLSSVSPLCLTCLSVTLLPSLSLVRCSKASTMSDVISGASGLCVTSFSLDNDPSKMWTSRTILTLANPLLWRIFSWDDTTSMTLLGTLCLRLPSNLLNFV
jgi:serine/threonine protein kinase